MLIFVDSRPELSFCIVCEKKILYSRGLKLLIKVGDNPAPRIPVRGSISSLLEFEMPPV